MIPELSTKTPQSSPPREIFNPLGHKKMNEMSWAVGEMQHMRSLYISETGRQPKGWIMGVDEYLTLKRAVLTQLSKDQRDKMGELDHFQGLPIIVKSTKGIELSMDVNAAIAFKEVKKILSSARGESLS